MAKKAVRKKKEKRAGSFVRSVIAWGGGVMLVVLIVIMLLGNFFDQPILDRPGQAISRIVTPVQTGFSKAVNWLTGYFRSMKYRSNLEYEYEQALLKIEELEDIAMMSNEYARRLNAYEDLRMEMVGHEKMNPTPATVIGHDTGNYFVTLELDKGTNDGVQDYMPVVFNGGLVGYTYGVQKSSCRVATIIDSDTTIPAKMDSNQDQGSVKGTYGLTGEALCRMYYLPENHLPRTGDLVVTSGVGMPFPKGIPVGTVRESTRGMEDNKQFVVIEPIVDFQHLEYVIIYRYIPSYAETAQLSEVQVQSTYVPLATPRPKPGFAEDVGTSFEENGVSTPIPVDAATPEPKLTETPAPAAETPTPAIVFATRTPEPSLEYQRITPTPDGPTPRPSPTPSPTPIPAFDMDAQQWEEEEEE